uniref:Putative secreted protein n=1 Tax=Amblyomma cajennense TaxID=34607 RepID=A0A023FRR7_AMBCJ
MKETLVAFCVVCFVASSAYKIPSSETTLEAEIDADSKAVAQEAILVGRILCGVARELANDETLGSEIDEYFFKKFWKNIKKVGGKVAGVAKQAGGKALEAVVSASKAAAGKALENAKKKLQEKATNVANKIVDKALGKYDFQDSDSGAGLVKYLCAQMNTVGQRLIEQGEKLSGLYDITF